VLSDARELASDLSARTGYIIPATPDRQHRLLPHSWAAPECTCKGAQKVVDTALHSAGLGRVEFMLGDEHPPTLLEGNFLSPKRRWLSTCATSRTGHWHSTR
jgi:hypothetical protein